MAQTFGVSIVTPAEIAFEGKAEIVVAPGAAGDLAALRNHAPLLTTLRIGVVRATVAEGAQEDAQQATRRIEYAVNGGFMQILPDAVVILTDTAVARGTVDADAARAELRRAEEALAGKRGVDDKQERDAVAWAAARLELTHKIS